MLSQFTMPISNVQENRLCLVPAFSPDPTCTLKFLPADQLSWEELTYAYNQTRIDYLVPMPMNAARLREYVHNYDVDLTASVVVVENDQILGLAMLGVRPGHTWPTRLGVLPISRQRGLGRLLMEHLLDQSRQRGAAYVTLEVIQGNEAAYKLFKRLGFQETRELLILRRPPGLPDLTENHAVVAMPSSVQALDSHRALALLPHRRSIPSWLDDLPSLRNAGQLAGLYVELKDGSRGWLVYRQTVFQLSHLVLQTEVGDPREVGRALLHALHTRHPGHDTNTENFPADDPHLPALQDLRYLEAFRRIEMRLDL